MPRAQIVVAAALAVIACSDAGRDRLVVRTVSDRTGAPIPGVLVQVDEQPWATTGADGKATFDPAVRPFTVRVHESGIFPDRHTDAVYVLRGRTASEVVAEVHGPGPYHEWHYARVSGSVAQRSGPPPTNVVRVGVAPFRDWSTWTVAAADGSFDFDVPWRAPPSETAATVVLHAWESDAASPPGHYYGFGSSAALSLLDGQVITGVPLSLEPVADGTVEGAVSLPAGLTPTDVLADLWLAFGRYEELLLFSSFVPPGSFAWAVPSVKGAEAWIDLSAGGSRYLRRVDVPSSGLVLDLPARPQLVAPAAGAAIGGAVFRWSPPEPGGSSTLYVACSWTDLAGVYTVVEYDVEAEGSEATLPAIPGTAAVPGGAACDWGVEWCAATDRAIEERCSGFGVPGATW